MSYANSLLVSGERILRRERQHWFVLVWTARYAVAALVLAAALLVIGATGERGDLLNILGYVALGLFVIGIAHLAWTWLRYLNEEYVVTSRRIIHAEGVINKKATDSSLEKINDAILLESLAGRIFGFGDLDVLTASESGIERLHMLRDAKGYKKAMLEAKHDLELEYTRPVMPPLRAATMTQVPIADPASPAPAPIPSAQTTIAGTNGSSTATAPAPAAPSLAATLDEVSGALDRLADLRDRGIITPEEFTAKKQELLGRL
jgi:hypothetical protein